MSRDNVGEKFFLLGRGAATNAGGAVGQGVRSAPFALLEAQMKKTIVRFGLISGVVLSLMMAATMPFAAR